MNKCLRKNFFPILCIVIAFHVYTRWMKLFNNFFLYPFYFAFFSSSSPTALIEGCSTWLTPEPSPRQPTKEMFCCGKTTLFFSEKLRPVSCEVVQFGTLKYVLWVPTVVNVFLSVLTFPSIWHILHKSWYKKKFNLLVLLFSLPRAHIILFSILINKLAIKSHSYHNAPINFICSQFCRY